jgi:hypothetical protein
MFSFFVAVSVGVVLFKLLILTWLALRFIPNNCVGVVEKLWSASGSVPEGGIIALKGEAGYQADLLRGGIHFGLWRWQYRVHTCPLVIVPQGKIGYVYARDGQPLPPSQTLGRVVNCNYFQDARSFLKPAVAVPRDSTKVNEPVQVGQRGRQLAILREGVYAINPALFIVITEDAVYTLGRLLSTWELQNVKTWQRALLQVDGFTPVVIGQRCAPVTRCIPSSIKLSTALASSRFTTVLRSRRVRSLRRKWAAKSATRPITTIFKMRSVS